MTPHIDISHLTGTTQMSRERFFQKLEDNQSVTVIRLPGYVDVFDQDGAHLARWIERSQVLHYAPKEAKPFAWPPTCPECGAEMEVKRDGDREPFWSCKGFPYRCQGRAPFIPHPDDRNGVGEREALYRSLERAQRDGLIGLTVAARKRRTRKYQSRLLLEPLPARS